MKNLPDVEFTTLFEKQRKSAPFEIKEAFIETLTLFITEPHHPSLRNHVLTGKLAGYRSIDVSYDWRALFKEAQTEKGTTYIFHKIGTHKVLYE